MAKKAKVTEVDPRIKELYDAVMGAISNEGGYVYGRKQRIVVDFYGTQHVFDALIKSWQQVVYLFRPERTNGDMALAVYKLTPKSYDYDGNGVWDWIRPGSELERRWFPVVTEFEQPKAVAQVKETTAKGTAVQMSLF